MVLLDRLKDGQSREWYLRASIEHGWSRNVLTHHISTGLQEREGKALTNFSRTLPAEDSDLTQQILKDPYSFEFLTLSSSAKEREPDMVEEQVHIEDLPIDFELHLASHEGKPTAQFQKQISEMGQQAPFELSLLGGRSERQEIELIRIF